MWHVTALARFVKVHPRGDRRETPRMKQGERFGEQQVTRHDRDDLSCS